MVSHDGGRPSGHGASELRGAWGGELEHVKACEVRAMWPVIRPMLVSVLSPGRNEDLRAALFSVGLCAVCLVM